MTPAIASAFRSRHFSARGAVRVVRAWFSAKVAREPLRLVREAEAELVVDAAELVDRLGDEALVPNVDPARSGKRLALSEDGLVAGDVLPRADLRERGLAQLAPTGHEHEAPAITAQLSEAVQRLREAVPDEPRPRAPGLHQRAHVVGPAAPEEDEGCAGKELREISDSQAVRRRLVDEPAAAREQAYRQVDVGSLALRDVRGAERVRVPAPILGVVELVPQDVPFALDEARARHPREARRGGRSSRRVGSR